MAIEALVVAGVAFLGVLGAVLTELNPLVRLALCLPLIVFTPGYALVRAAAPRASLSLLTGFVMGVGCSMAIAALSGLVLELTPGGMTGTSWTTFLFTITIVCSAILVVRTLGSAGGAWAVRSRLPGLLSSVNQRQGRINVLFFVASFAIVLIAFGVAVRAYHDQPRPGFTQMWLVPQGAASTVTVGVRNDEGRPIEGSVVLTHDGKVEAQWPNISLNDGEVWQADLQVPDFQNGDEPLQATLTLEDSPGSVYRYVTLWPSTARLSGT